MTFYQSVNVDFRQMSLYYEFCLLTKTHVFYYFLLVIPCFSLPRGYPQDMEINPNQNMAIIPIRKGRTYFPVPHQGTGVVSQDHSGPSKHASDHEPRRLPRVVPFEKGHLVDIYV